MAQVNKALGYERRGYLLLLVNKQTNLIRENQTVPGLGRPVGHELVAGHSHRPGKEIGAWLVIPSFSAKHKVGLLQNLRTEPAPSLKHPATQVSGSSPWLQLVP